MIPTSDIAFTDAVKALQTERGSRAAYARMEQRGGFRSAITPELIAFLATTDTAFLATANAAGQPYAQHRGGPPGFIRAIDHKTLGFADFTGNRQYITAGNLVENSRAFLFLIDYASRQRVKLWGKARVSHDPALIANLMPDGYRAEPEQAILFEVTAWDRNCPQHIPVKHGLATLAALHDRIAELEAENAALAAQLQERNQ